MNQTFAVSSRSLVGINSFAADGALQAENLSEPNGPQPRPNYDDAVSDDLNFGAKANMNVTRGVVWLARSGYAARGMVYVIVGFFAIMAALGSGETVDTRGAVQQLLGQPFGA
ncbi:DUF1206 domain-containing protein, partial [Stutzerimonas kunmingensis]|uniref:DUF1206 domain-containing protein n=1 Tax=Stutzerimonas kunmingensis TaxID=1211807 RepID=UPI0028A02507